MKAPIKKKFSILLIRKIFISCCFDELKVVKPGNLSFNSPIYGMNKKFFFRASELSAPILTKKESLGKKIFSTTNLCLTELKSNYNLGIILLCAPIIDVALNGFKNIQDLKKLKSAIKKTKPDKVPKRHSARENDPCHDHSRHEIKALRPND